MVSCAHSVPQIVHLGLLPVPVCIVLWGKGIGKDQCGWPFTVTFLKDKSDVTTISWKFQAPQSSPAFVKMRVYFNNNSPCLSSSYQNFLLQGIYPSPEISGSLTSGEGHSRAISARFSLVSWSWSLFTTALSRGAFHSPAGWQAVHWYPSVPRVGGWDSAAWTECLTPHLRTWQIADPALSWVSWPWGLGTGSTLSCLSSTQLIRVSFLSGCNLDLHTKTLIMSLPCLLIQLAHSCFNPGFAHGWDSRWGLIFPVFEGKK